MNYRTWSTIAAMVLVACYATSSEAALRHRYTFNNTLADSINGANGVYAGGLGAPVFTGGQLDLTANVGEASNGIVNDHFVDLPNGIISGAAAAGTPGALTLEWWATPSTINTWMRLGDFAVSNGPEGVSAGSVFDNSTNLFVTIADGRSGNRPAAYDLYDGPAPGTSDLAFNFAAGAAVLTAGNEVHIAATYDMNNLTAGPAGTILFYVNGVQEGQAPMSAGININSFNDNNNWLGRSQFPDQVFIGKFNEFRIYDMALSASDVAVSFANGPDVLVPEPSTCVMALAVLGLLTMRSRRQS